ncbi:MAG: hypothetical protein WC683_05115 [bacterium]
MSRPLAPPIPRRTIEKITKEALTLHDRITTLYEYGYEFNQICRALNAAPRTVNRAIRAHKIARIRVMLEQGETVLDIQSEVNIDTPQLLDIIQRIRNGEDIAV